jgi:hypothetical protein
MINRLLRAAAALLIFLALTAPVTAQAPAEPGASLSPPAPTEKPGPNPVPGLTIAFVCTVLILFIICRPARKL